MAAGGGDHASLMLEAVKIAEHALLQKEVPVGCVVVEDDGGAIVARGCNQVNATLNATRHAELVAIDQLIQLSKERGTKLEEMCRHCTLYVTVEPCVMCAYALRLVGLTKIVFGCSNVRFGGCGSVMEVATTELYPPSSEAESGAGDCRTPAQSLLPELQLTAGVMRDKSITLLQQFYEGENPHAPEEKAKRKTKKKQPCATPENH